MTGRAEAQVPHRTGRGMGQAQGRKPALLALPWPGQWRQGGAQDTLPFLPSSHQLSGKVCASLRAPCSG